MIDLFYRSQVWFGLRALRLSHWINTTGTTPPDTRDFQERREDDERPLIELPNSPTEGLAYTPRRPVQRRRSQTFPHLNDYTHYNATPLQDNCIRILEDL